MNSVPKILIYIEIFTELDRPYFHEAWVEFSARFIDGMKASGHPVDRSTMRILTNDALAQACEKHGFRDHLSVIQERAFLEIFGTDYLTASIAGYRRTLSDDTLNGAAEFIRRALGTFVPDAIVTYSTAPWLQQAFPDAVVLHKEYGAFSRPPFPESFYLDPNGKFANATIRRHEKALRAYQASSAERTMIESLRSFFCNDILRKASPFYKIEELMRQERQKILLLPLQFCGHYGFEGTGRYRTQGEVVRDVIERIDPRIGVLVVNHSTAHHHGTIPPHELYVYLGKRHTNLFHNDDINKIIHPSQFLLAHVDMVATVSSSVGLQALLWNKPVVALGDSHINAIADYTRLEDVPGDGPTETTWDKTDALAWLLTHYYIPAPYYSDGNWLRSYVDRSVTRWREGRRGLDFFDPIDTADGISRTMIANADHRVPFIRIDSPEETAQT